MASMCALLLSISFACKQFRIGAMDAAESFMTRYALLNSNFGEDPTMNRVIDSQTAGHGETSKFDSTIIIRNSWCREVEVMCR